MSWKLNNWVSVTKNHLDPIIILALLIDLLDSKEDGIWDDIECTTDSDGAHDIENSQFI